MLYSELQCSEAIRKAVERMGFAEMTEIQEKTIPLMLAGHDVIAKLNVHGRAHLAILHRNFNHRLAAFLGLQGGGAVAIQHAAQRAAVLRHGNLRAGRHILRGISQRRGAQQKGRRQRQQKQHDSFHYSFSQAALRARQQMAAAAVRQTASVR